MRISTVIPCVNYDDFLALTLPRTISVLENVTILTAPEDVRTLAVARAHRVPVFVTDAWWTGAFNKARALNKWLDSLGEASAEDAWCLTLDADILLPEGEPLDPNALNRSTLYAAPTPA
jgi:hypothetical protein